MLSEALLPPVLLSELVNNLKKFNSVAKISAQLIASVMVLLRHLLFQRLLIFGLMTLQIILYYAMSHRSCSIKGFVKPRLPASSATLFCFRLPEVLLRPGRLLHVGDLVLGGPLDDG